MPVEKVFFTNSEGMSLAAWLHVPDGTGPFPAVVRVHGYKSSKDGRTSTAFAACFPDMVFLRFDFHCHGESECRDGVDAARCVDDLKSAVAYVRSLRIVDQTKIAVIGSSLGGLAVTLAAAGSDSIAAAVAICPVSTFEPFRVRDIKYQKLLGIDVYHEAEKISVPFLIIHGDKDTIVPVTQSIELGKHLKAGKLHVARGADHSFSQETHHAELLKTAAEFIKGVFAHGTHS